MKKLLALILVLVSLTAVLPACSNDATVVSGQQSTEPAASVQNTVTVDSATESTAADTVQNMQMTDPYDGTVLMVDMSRNGVIDENAEAVGSRRIVLNGVTYEFPFAMGALFANGWSLPPSVSFDKEFMAGVETQLIGCSLLYEERDYLDIGEVWNDSNSPKPLDACLVTDLSIDISYRLNLEKTFSFVLPGGITWDSTAADVITVFGSAQNNANFDMVRVSEKGLQYLNTKTPGMQYYFRFNEDGTIYSLSIEITN